MAHRVRTSVLLLCLSIVVGCGDDSGDTEDGGAGGGSEGSVCESGCAETLVADCSNGPASQSACVSDCEMLQEGSCGTEYKALLSCNTGGSVTCDASSGIPIVAGCEDEQSAFVACINP